MSQKKQILKGTLILTAAGFITRILGLYNRVFLANVISASELGLYQLVFPVLNVCMAVCCNGLESAMSKMISAQSADQCHENMKRTVKIGLTLALGLAILLCFGVYGLSEQIAASILQEPSCAPYLKIMSMVLPFSTMHACTLGYFFGLQKTAVPAFSQLLEQIVRVGTIYILSIYMYMGGKADASLAVYGMLAGEIVSCIFTVLSYKITSWAASKRESSSTRCVPPQAYRKLFGQLWGLAYPLTVNRLALTILQSAEAVLIPMMLGIYYNNSETALEIYGVAMGMAFPFIMFPMTLTNALSTMLLPAVSRASAQKEFDTISRTVSKSVHYCLLIGILSFSVFYVYGNMLGIVIFKNQTAGYFLKMFALLCPMMYATSALSSTLNGLGQVKKTLVHSMISLTVRIGFLIFAVPEYGIQGYLWGMLVGYLILILLNGYYGVKLAGLHVKIVKTLLIPAVFAVLSVMFSMAVYQFLIHFMALPVIVVAAAACGSLAVVYILMLLCGGILDVPQRKR